MFKGQSIGAYLQGRVLNPGHLRTPLLRVKETCPRPPKKKKKEARRLKIDKFSKYIGYPGMARYGMLFRLRGHMNCVDSTFVEENKLRRDTRTERDLYYYYYYY